MFGFLNSIGQFSFSPKRTKNGEGRLFEKKKIMVQRSVRNASVGNVNECCEIFQ